MKNIKTTPNKGYLGSELWVPKAHINVEGTKSALTFVLTDRERMTTLKLYKETETHLLVPREFWDVRQLPFPVVDIRPRSFTSVDFKSRIVLDKISGGTTQQEALGVLLNSRGGVLQLACGKGKSVVALELAARMRVPTLIVVDNTQLLSQWRDLILGKPGKNPAMLGLADTEVGLIQGAVFDWKKPIVLSTYQTLAQRADGFPEEVRRWFGLIVWDEAHHIGAPTFSRTATLFYGYRLGLTATPTRSDGLHVIYDFHLGSVVYKDLKQELRPKIYFKYTGMQLDPNDVAMMAMASDKNGELHNSKLASFFGQWRPRLNLIINEVAAARADGRKTLVLSNSIDELVNLLCLWTNYPSMYTDIPVPTAEEVGYHEVAVKLDKRSKTLLATQTKKLKQLYATHKDSNVRKDISSKLRNIEKRIESDQAFAAIEALLHRRQRQFIKDLLDKPSDSGLMIAAVKPEVRKDLLASKGVTFAITKYGREGLDEASLETIIICEPMSAKNGLQQTMGRVLRPKPGKREPAVIILEDDIGPMAYMCRHLRQHLREWPVDEGGPYDYEMVNHPSIKRARSRLWEKRTRTGLGGLP